MSTKPLRPDHPTTQAYRWLLETFPVEYKYGQRARALETLKLKVEQGSSYKKIAAILGGKWLLHSARCDWARKTHRRAMAGEDVTTVPFDAERAKEQDRLRRYKNESRQVLIQAIARGEFLPAKKHACDICWQPAAEWHHLDYDKPLDVTPLCKRCHVELHAELRRKKK